MGLFDLGSLGLVPTRRNLVSQNLRNQVAVDSLALNKRKQAFIEESAKEELRVEQERTAAIQMGTAKLMQDLNQAQDIPSKLDVLGDPKYLPLAMDPRGARVMAAASNRISMEHRMRQSAIEAKTKLMDDEFYASFKARGGSDDAFAEGRGNEIYDSVVDQMNATRAQSIATDLGIQSFSYEGKLPVLAGNGRLDEEEWRNILSPQSPLRASSSTASISGSGSRSYSTTSNLPPTMTDADKGRVERAAAIERHANAKTDQERLNAALRMEQLGLPTMTKAQSVIFSRAVSMILKPEGAGELDILDSVDWSEVTPDQWEALNVLSRRMNIPILANGPARIISRGDEIADDIFGPAGSMSDLYGQDEIDDLDARLERELQEEGEE